MDTAATKSIVSRALVPPECLCPIDINLLAANEMALKIVGQATLTLEAEGHQWTHNDTPYVQTLSIATLRE